MTKYTNIQNGLKDYYSNLLIVQYNGKTKAKSTINKFVDLFFANMVLMQIRDAFDWTTAVGNQLDIIGKWVGCSRFYNGQLFDSRPWFALIDWNDTPDNLQGGFSTFETFDELEGGFLDYPNLQPLKNKLNDKAYRIMIGLKIIYNSINHTAKPIDEAIWNYFEGKVYTIWESHKLIYMYKAEVRDVMQVAESKGVLPCPIGCSIELREIIE